MKITVCKDSYQRRARVSDYAQRFLPDAHLVKADFVGKCHRCKIGHEEQLHHPALFSSIAFDWLKKHERCWMENHDNVTAESRYRQFPKGFDDRNAEKLGNAPWWMNYKSNADIKMAYAADAAFTLTAASLATSSTFLAGREATSVSNTTNKYLDYDISGKVTTGTSPTADKELRVYYIRPINDTPTWPDVFDGTDSAETVTNAQILSTLVLGWSSPNSNASDIAYPIVNAHTLISAFGAVPDNFTLFLTHNTGVNLNSTGGNHEFNYRGLYATAT